MSNEVSANPMNSNTGDSNQRLCAELPTIRILIYTDDPEQVTVSDDPTAIPLGIGLLKKHLEAHKPAFAKLDPVTLISRNPNKDTHATEKLDSLLNNPFEQLWVFGIHQVNREHFQLGIPGGGGPQSELDANEVERLKEWMKRGGVLMAGDHSNPDPRLPPGSDTFCPAGVNHETFLGLGRALGYKVPRAGLLRKWEGPPTRCPEDTYNTQVAPAGDFENSNLQHDQIPQELTLKTYETWGMPGKSRQPHPLFIGKQGHWINVFPDHIHEGQLVIPKDFSDTTVWPEVGGFQPQLHGIAYGMDKRNNNVQAIVAAYDGDCAGVGRIVADSTWHHYFNENLTGFPVDVSAATASGLIGQYYGNLAVWLSPLETRREMACAMFCWLAHHPLILEEVGSGALNIGQTAYYILSRTASPCEIQELLQAWLPCALRAKYRPLYFHGSSSSLSPIPSQKMILGAVLERYHQEMVRASGRGLFGLEQMETNGGLIIDGLARAFNLQHGVLHGTGAAASDLLTLFGAAGSGW
jgi:hypothetical protein